MQTRLIMIEGVPFTGKSTLSEYVTQQLELNGVAAQWVPEGMMLQQYFPHALDVLNDKQSVSEASLWQDWSAFAQVILAAPTTFVVDAALSYAAVHLLMTADRPQTAILDELRRLAELCATLRPRVIHMTGDMARLAPASIVQRGEGWQEHLVGQAESFPYQQARGRSGIAGAIALLDDSQALMHEVLEDGGWETLTLDVTAGDWSTMWRAALDFLGVPQVVVERPDLSLADLRSYTGAYTAHDPDGSSETLSVRLEQEDLALYGPRMRFGMLVPLSTTRFHVSATRLDVEFAVEAGSAQRMLVFTPDGNQHSFERTSTPGA